MTKNDDKDKKVTAGDPFALPNQAGDKTVDQPFNNTADDMTGKKDHDLTADPKLELPADEQGEGEVDNPAYSYDQEKMGMTPVDNSTPKTRSNTYAEETEKKDWETDPR